MKRFCVFVASGFGLGLVAPFAPGTFGSLPGVALAYAVCVLPLWLQIVCFAVVSVATLLLTRPLAKKYINSKTMATNADRVIGSKAVVKERIDELAGTGAVLADGKMWSARTADGAVAEPGEVVTVLEIRGVRLIVEPVSPPEEAV